MNTVHAIYADLPMDALVLSVNFELLYYMTIPW